MGWFIHQLACVCFFSSNMYLFNRATGSHLVVIEMWKTKKRVRQPAMWQLRLMKTKFDEAVGIRMVTLQGTK